jgi:hypothetical protein
MKSSRLCGPERVLTDTSFLEAVDNLTILSLYDVARYERNLRVWSLAERKKPLVLLSAPPLNNEKIKLSEENVRNLKTTLGKDHRKRPR